MKKLKQLKLDYNALTDFDRESSFMDTLELLTLNDNQIKSFTGFVFKSLTELQISNNNLTEFNNNRLEKLQRLYLNKNAGLSALFSTNNTFGSLTELELK